jgi:hypothetical protein
MIIFDNDFFDCAKNALLYVLNRQCLGWVIFGKVAHFKRLDGLSRLALKLRDSGRQAITLSLPVRTALYVTQRGRRGAPPAPFIGQGHVRHHHRGNQSSSGPPGRPRSRRYPFFRRLAYKRDRQGRSGMSRSGGRQQLFYARDQSIRVA